MPKSRHRKNHKQKVNARRIEIENQKRRSKKQQHEFLMNLIKQEQEKGSFDQTPNINLDNLDLSTEGPSI